MIRENSKQPLRIDICVCTYRRRELDDTLRSLGELIVPANAAVRIIVADNDATPSARDRVNALAAGIPFEVVYVHCPASNISIARNACLDNWTGDFLVFIDDDETASKEWLAELLEVAEATDADVVLGPVLALYADDAPGWMRRGDFHSTAPVWVKNEIRTGYTANTLLRRASPHVAGRRFNLALGRTGGEDTEYFTQLHQAGGTIAFAPRAAVYEPVPQNRTQFSWLTKRRFRMGQTHGRLVGEERQLPGIVGQVGLAAAKAIYCFVAASFCAVSCIQAWSAGCSAFAKSASTANRQGGAPMQPDVSFVIAAFNAERTIARAIESATAQRDVTVEVVVADDCSIDRTVEIARSFPPELVRVVALEKNRGPGGARNAGFEIARGRWVAVLDSDDMVYPDRLARMIERAERLDAQVAVDNLDVVQRRPCLRRHRSKNSPNSPSPTSSGRTCCLRRHSPSDT